MSILDYTEADKEFLPRPPTPSATLRTDEVGFRARLNAENGEVRRRG